MATPPLLKRLNEENGARHDPERRADLPGRDRAAGRHLEADRLARAPVAARRRPRARGGRRPGRAELRRSLLRARPTKRRSCSRSISAPASCAACSATSPAGVRARQDVELRRGRRRSRARRDRPVRPTASPRWRASRPGAPSQRSWSACPASSRRETGLSASRLNVAGLDGRRFGTELEERLGGSVTVENDVNLAALGEGSLVLRTAWTTSSSSRSVPASERGSCSAASCSVGPTARRASSTTSASGGRDIDPCAAISARFARSSERADVIDASLRRASIFAAARNGDASHAPSWRRSRRRIALHIVPLAAVTDVGLVVLGGGIGANERACSTRGIRARLQAWLPSPPRVEAFSLGDAAVLTGEARGRPARRARENSLGRTARGGLT